jgi:hypothetical protein
MEFSTLRHSRGRFEQILRILAALGQNDRKSSEHMFTSLFDCMKRADTGINAGYAGASLFGSYLTPCRRRVHV